MKFQTRMLFLTLLFFTLKLVSATNTRVMDDSLKQREFVPPKIKSLNYRNSESRPDISVLEDKGYSYNFKGKPIKLLRIKNRVTLSYKPKTAGMHALFKKKKYFNGAAFRQLRAGLRSLEVVTVEKRAVENKSGAEAFHEIITALEEDSSVAFAAPVYYAPESDEGIIITDRVIVKISGENKDTFLRTIASVIDAEYEEELMSQVMVFKCNNPGRRDALQRCMDIGNLPGVVWAEPEMTLHLQKYYTPDDPFYSKQWHHFNDGVNGGVYGADMKVSSAWDIQQMGDTNITIAVLDGGFDLAHPDLSMKRGKDFCGGDNDFDPSPASETDRHGTAVAGVAAGIGNNGIGIAGVAAGAKILPVKILDEVVDLNNSQIASAITWAYQNGADVINNSWGLQTSTPSNVIQNAIIDASILGRNGKGCPVFCASGNSASQFVTYTLPFTSSTSCYIALAYQKDRSGSAGDDNVVIDNVVLYGSNGTSLVFNETFSANSLPSGWTTCGGIYVSGTPVTESTVPGWYRTTTVYQAGFGDQAAICSGNITDSQWTEIRLPYRSYKLGEKLVFRARVSSEEGHDFLKIRYYNFSGQFYSEMELNSGVANETVAVVSYPAKLDSAIAVGASTDMDFRSDYSQYDMGDTAKTVDFLAPSGGGLYGIWTTDITGTAGYSSTDYEDEFSGTSAACPAASGLAALILSRNPQLSRNKVLEVMRSTCDKIGGVTYVNGVHKEYGYGRLNARKALENLPPVITGQLAVQMLRNGSRTLTGNDLIILDTETPDGPFNLTVLGGNNYSVNGTTITVANGFAGSSLTVPVKVSDGTYYSDIFNLTITFRDNNYAPVISGQKALTMLEDGKLYISASDLTISDQDDLSGPFIVTVGPGSNYTIVGDTILPVADFNGILNIPVTASDRITSSIPFNLQVTVTPVNDAPSFTAGTNITVTEDCGPQINTAWATAISAGPLNESGQSMSFIASANNNALFAEMPEVDASGTLSFTPAANASGSSKITLYLTDNGGTVNGGQNRSVAKEFTITVIPVNDPPEFTAGPEITVLEDAGKQVRTQWALINTGAPDETEQEISVSVKVSDSTLFTVMPWIDSLGTLFFTPAANRYGKADVNVTLRDNGGTENGGNDTKIAAPFSITIVPVNDAPVFTPGSDITISEDDGVQSFANWAGNISAGENESTQNLRFRIVNSNSNLFSIQPAIDASGKLTFETAPDLNGTALLKIRLFDDAGVDNGGVDSSTEANLVINIVPVNDMPRISIKGKNNMEPRTVSVIHISASDADGEIPEISVDGLPPFAVLEKPAGSATASITFSPQTDTGNYQFRISAIVNTDTTDTIFNLRVRIIPVGDIMITGVSSKAVTRLFATAGWYGKQVLTGSGKIANVKEGIYLLTISDSGARTGYYYSEVVSGRTDTIVAATHPVVPIMFTAGDTLRTLSGPLYTGGPGSVVIDDADGDGKRDIIYTGTDGIIWSCKGNDSSFSDPVIIHSTEKGKNILRCVDWDEDGVNDIVSANINGNINLSLGTSDGLFQEDSVLLTTGLQCTGIEFDAHQTEGKAMYLGLSNGNLKYARFDQNGSIISDVHTGNAQLFDAGDDASIVRLDINGDGTDEMLVGNRNGTVKAYSILSFDTVCTLGMVIAGGMPLELNSMIVISSTYGLGADLASLVYADGNGTLYRSTGVLRGDINNDGKVDILDLQQLGIHWGQRSNDSGWKAVVNLSVSTGTSDPQIINVLDLQVLGNCWGLIK